jgi:hypothetical protein
LEEVAVAGADRVFAVAGDRFFEVEEDSESGGGDAASVVADLLGGAARDVAGAEVSEGGILAFKVVVAFVLGDVGGLGTQMRPSFRRDSDMRVSFDW